MLMIRFISVDDDDDDNDDGDDDNANSFCKKKIKSAKQLSILDWD